MKNNYALVAAFLGAVSLTQGSYAAVSAAEAAKLNTELTPLGGERAGNADGSIPAWTGGFKTIPSDGKPGRRSDPFANEKPIFSIDAKNLDQYKDKLSDGTIALLKKYPDTYRLDVYKTQRTASAPQSVYDNTFKNATLANLKGDLFEHAYGGIPFPIPKNGIEVMWNNVLKWRAPSYRSYANQYIITANGKMVLASSLSFDPQSMYYLPGNSAESIDKTQEFWEMRMVMDGPPNRVGEATVARSNVNGDLNSAWLYLPGQRRVRRLPNVCCDTPNAGSNGILFADEVEIWFGRMDQFDWTLVGKKELYIPYNVNKQLSVTNDADIVKGNHFNPDNMRWELHRVWVVDANLRPGKRHAASKGRYYCDEDTWMCTLADRWDSKGQLWRTLWMENFVAPELPGVVWGAVGYSDLLSGQGYAGGLMGSKPIQYEIMPPYPQDHFTADSLAGEGVR